MTNKSSLPTSVHGFCLHAQGKLVYTKDAIFVWPTYCQEPIGVCCEDCYSQFFCGFHFICGDIGSLSLTVLWSKNQSVTGATALKPQVCLGDSLFLPKPHPTCLGKTFHLQLRCFWLNMYLHKRGPRFKLKKTRKQIVFVYSEIPPAALFAFIFGW